MMDGALAIVIAVIALALATLFRHRLAAWRDRALDAVYAWMRRSKGLA